MRVQFPPAHKIKKGLRENVAPFFYQWRKNGDSNYFMRDRLITIALSVRKESLVSHPVLSINH